MEASSPPPPPPEGDVKLFSGVMAVSYTHLDVYKRQTHASLA